MRPLVSTALSALAVLACALPAHADIVICVPFVSVRVGRAPAPPGMPAPTTVAVRAPFVNLFLAGRPRPPRPVLTPAPRPIMTPPVIRPGDPPPVPVEPRPGEELAPAPRRVSLPPPIAPPVAAVPVLSVGQFMSTFRPLGGNYEVVLRHPLTGTPVKVAFSLPPGAPRKVRVFKRRLVFDYGRRSVVVRFYRDGTAEVRY